MRASSGWRPCEEVEYGLPDAYGSNNLRDASLTPKKEIAPLVIPDDITNLPSLHGFIKFPDGFPAARIVLTWRDYPEVAPQVQPAQTVCAERS